MRVIPCLDLVLNIFVVIIIFVIIGMIIWNLKFWIEILVLEKLFSFEQTVDFTLVLVSD